MQYRELQISFVSRHQDLAISMNENAQSRTNSSSSFTGGMILPAYKC